MTRSRLSDRAWIAVSVLCASGVIAAGGAAILRGGDSFAAGKPQPKMNAYFASDFTDTAYQQAAVNKVLKAWKAAPPWPEGGHKTVVISTIGRDGALLEARQNLSSGLKGFDDAALAAVKGGAPFAPFPKAYTRATIEVHWHFEMPNA